MRAHTFPALLIATLLGGCGVAFGGPPLISGHSVASAQSQSSEPQSLNSLPPGAAGLPSGPNSTAPNYLAVRLGAGAGPRVY